MAYTLNIDSFAEQNIRERTTLSSAVDAGVTSLPVVSTVGYAVGDIIYVGPLSREGCEKAVVAAVPSETILTLSAALKLAHSASDDVTSVLGDKIHIYRAVNVDDSVPSDEAFTVLATREIDPDQTSTYYRDSAGSSGYWYRTSYYNETTLEETPLSEAFRGEDFGHYASLTEIRTEAGFDGAIHLKDSVIGQQRRAAESEINAALASVYTVPFDPVPDVVRTLTIQLAAALLLVQAYGNTAPFSTRLKDARAALQEYVDQSASIVDASGQSTAATSVSSYFGTEDRLFGIGDVY